MSRHRYHTQIALSFLRARNGNLNISIDGDGDIVVDQGGNRVFIAVSDSFVKCYSIFSTNAPVNALAVISRRISRDLLVGKLDFPDQGGQFFVSYSHAYLTEEFREFDVLHTFDTLFFVVEKVVEKARELGYVL